MASTKVTRFFVLPLVVLSLLIIAVIVILYTATGGKIQPNYGIVIDAGSSKTAINLFSWPGEKYKATGVVKQEYYEKVNQPMAKFENVTKFGEFLLPYLAEVNKEIMSGRVEHTRLYLAATAGMRMLNLTKPETAKILLKTTKATLKKETSLIIEEVTIMPGKMEALNAWIAVNYLMDRLKSGQNGNTFGMLDMGGASSQIAYVSPDKDIDIKLYGKEYNVKARSDLCYGADEAGFRFIAELIRKAQSESNIVNPCLPKGAVRKYKGSELLENPCLDGSLKALIKNDTEYVFTGKSDYLECKADVDNMIKNCGNNYERCAIINEPFSEKQKFIAMSSYFFNSRVLNLTDNTITKDGFREQTDFICKLTYDEILNYSKATRKFANEYCFRLNYIYKMLDQIYKFQGDWTNIIYKNKDDKGTEFGWPIGLMIKSTNAIPAEVPSDKLINRTPFIILMVIFSIILTAGIFYLIKIRNND